MSPWFFCHWYVSVPSPVAATVNVAVEPGQTFCATGCCVIVGGLAALMSVHFTASVRMISAASG